MTTTTDSFEPTYGTGTIVSPSTTAASVSLPLETESVVLTNLSTDVTVYVRIGEGTQTASTQDYPVLPSTQISLSKGRFKRVLSYVTSAGTGSLHIILGRGL
jgi:hypothetical protein